MAINNFSVSAFRTANGLAYGGARPALFYVTGNFPTGVTDVKQKLMFTCKGATLPATNVGKIETRFLGRVVPQVGDRSFEDLTLTVINDEDFAVRKAFEGWMNQLQNNSDGLRQAANLHSKFVVTQKGKDGGDIYSYTFHNCFPTTVASIELNWDSADTIEEFQVTLAYDYFDGASGKTADLSASNSSVSG